MFRLILFMFQRLQNLFTNLKIVIYSLFVLTLKCPMNMNYRNKDAISDGTLKQLYTSLLGTACALYSIWNFVQFSHETPHHIASPLETASSFRYEKSSQQHIRALKLYMSAVVIRLSTFCMSLQLSLTSIYSVLMNIETKQWEKQINILVIIR